MEMQAPDQPRAEHKCCHHGCQHAQDGAKGEKLEDAKTAVKLLQVVGEIHQHGAPPATPAFRLATTRSMRALRDPLTSTTGGCARLCDSAAASACASWSLSANQAAPSPKLSPASRLLSPRAHRRSTP